MTGIGCYSTSITVWRWGFWELSCSLFGEWIQAESSKIKQETEKTKKTEPHYCRLLWEWPCLKWDLLFGHPSNVHYSPTFNWRFLTCHQKGLTNIPSLSKFHVKLKSTSKSFWFLLLDMEGWKEIPSTLAVKKKKKKKVRQTSNSWLFFKTHWRTGL